MSMLSNLINLLQSQDIFNYYLPFLLTFSIFYALIVKSKIFGNEALGKRISLIVALVAGLYVTIATPLGIGLSQFFASFFAQASVFLTLIIVISVTAASLATPMFLGEDEKLLGNPTAKYIVLGIIVLVSLGMFLASSNNIPGFPRLRLGISSEDLALILLGVGTLGLIVWTAMGAEKNGGASSGSPSSGGNSGGSSN